MECTVVVFLDLDELPPAISLIYELLDLGYHINLITEYDNSQYKEIFGEKVVFHSLLRRKKDDLKKGKTFLQKAKWIFVKIIENLKLRNTPNVLHQYVEKGNDIWILHEYTAKHIGKGLLKIPYILTLYELDQKLLESKNNLLKKLVCSATDIVVPEYCRANIVKACLQLKKLPYIIPNKPSDLIQDEPIEQDFNKNILENIEKLKKLGKKIILYSGIFIEERKLDTFIETVLQNKEKYCLVLMGRQSSYLERLQQKYPNSFIYLGFIQPPQHLEIVKLADVGILVYVADQKSINPVFCAPNKIFEYAKYGIPMICNDIPGLKYSVEYNGMGVCCNVEYISDIENKLEQIIENHDKMSDNAKNYYKNVNLKESIRKVINRDIT